MCVSRNVEIQSSLSVEAHRRYQQDDDSPLVKMLARDVALAQLQAAFADSLAGGSRAHFQAQARFFMDRQRITHRRLKVA
jgi:hypothetical protein